MRGGRQILIVEPEAASRERMATLLDGLGHRVRVAEDRDGMNAALDARGPDLLIATAELDPVTLIDELEARSVSARLVVLVDDTAAGVRALDAGASAFVLRPFTLEGLEREVRRVLAAPRRGSSIPRARTAVDALPEVSVDLSDLDAPRSISIAINFDGDTDDLDVKVVAPPKARPLPPQLGRYTVIRQLGAGGMGAVYEAADPMLNRRVALKMMRADLLAQGPRREVLMERFRREASVAAQISHPNVASVYDFGEHEQQLYLVMELVSGLSLPEAVAIRGAFSPPEVMQVARDVQSALTLMHDHGVVHRDIKPANIIRTEQGVTKVVDFGLARVEDSTLTAQGQLVGSLGYIAPEVMGGNAADVRSDQFALAISLYELLLGHRLFVGRSVKEVVTQLLQAEPPDLSRLGVPPRFEQILARMYAQDPADRFDDDHALLSELEALVAAHPSGAEPE